MAQSIYCGMASRRVRGGARRQTFFCALLLEVPKLIFKLFRRKTDLKIIDVGKILVGPKQI